MSLASRPASDACPFILSADGPSASTELQDSGSTPQPRFARAPGCSLMVGEKTPLSVRGLRPQAEVVFP